MSATRLIIRLFLVAILLGLGGLVYFAWRNSKPENVIARAQSTLDSGNAEGAVLRLRQAADRFEKDADVRYLLSKAILKDAEQKGSPDTTYGRNDEARKALFAAAELAPNNLELQKEAMALFVRGRRPADGAKYADNVLKEEPDNVDALFIKVHKGVLDKNRGTPKLVENLLEKSPERRFQLYGLLADYYQRTKNPEKVQETLTIASDELAKLTKKDVDEMPRAESDAMSKLASAAVHSATDTTTALERAGRLLDTLEKFPINEPAVLNDVARISGEMMLEVDYAFKPSQDTAEQKALRTALRDRIDTLGGKAVETKTAGPLVYYTSALKAFEAGDHEKTAKILDEAFATIAKQSNVRPEYVLELDHLAARNYLIMRKFKEADPHLRKLLANKDFKGRGELLTGGMHSAQGRFEKAYEHFIRAERELGQNLFVHMGLAQACQALGKWEEALLHYSQLHESFDTADVELRAWAVQHEISHATVHFGEFRANLGLKRWDEAMKHLSALAGTPLEARANAMAVNYLYNNDKKEQALAILAAARKKKPDDVALLQMEAAYLIAAGKKDEAGKQIEAFAAADAKDVQRQMLLVRWKLSQDREGAMALLEKLEQQFPKETAPMLYRALALLAQNKLDEAQEVAKKMKERPETASAANLLVAAIQMRKDDPKAAAIELEEASGRSPDHGLIKLLQGEVAAAQGDYEGAIANLSRTIDVTPLRGQARAMLIKSLLMLAEKEGPEAAEKKLLPLVEAHPNDAFLKIALADFKFKQGQFETAMQLLDHAETLEPTSANLAYIKASIWLQRNRIDLAYKEVERGLKIEPEHMMSRGMAADLALRQGLNKEAFDHTAAALKVNENMPGMILAQTQALVGLRRHDDAVKLMQLAIAKTPKIDLYYDRLAAVQLDLGKPDDALATIRKGREQMPEDLILAAAEVAIQCKQNKLEDAEATAKAFTKDQTKFDRFFAVAQAFFREKQFANARDWGGQALALAEDKVKPAVHMFLGDVNLVEYDAQTTKDKETLARARDHFQAVLAVYPNHYIAGNNLAWLLATEFEQPKEAAEVIDRVRGKATVEQMPVNFIDTVAVVYREADRLDEAQQVLERANNMYQDHSLLLYQLAVVQNERKQFAAAQTTLKKAINLGVPEKYKKPAKELQDALKSSGETNTSAPAETEK